MGLQSQTRLSDRTELKYSGLGNPIDKAALWVQSIGSQTVRHDLATKQQGQQQDSKDNGFRCFLSQPKLPRKQFEAKF